MEKDLKDKSLGEISAVINSLSEKPYLAKVIFQWIHKHGASGIEEMTNTPRGLKNKLKQGGYYISNLVKEKFLEDKEGTAKYVFKLPDNNIIETVLLNDGKRKEERLTLCISSQVGCRMHCTFCATGRLPYKRNLTAGEIADQIIQVEKDLKQKIQNVVFMGMGEPLDNYDSVLKAIQILNSELGKNIGARRITVSTCGIVPGIKKLAREKLQVRLAVSLPSAFDAVRNKIAPVSREYPIEKLRQALKYYQAETKRRMTIEYLLIKDTNDGQKDLEGLLKFLKGLDVYINLIEYNPFPNNRLKAAGRKTMAFFKKKLAEAGYQVACRYKRGRKIKAACGQLGSQVF